MIPHDPVAENAVVGACMISDPARAVATDHLAPGDFYDATLAAVFATIIDLAKAGSATDPVTVLDRLKAEGRADTLADLVDIQRITPSTKNTRSYCEIVARMAAARRLMALGASIVERAQDPAVDPLDAADGFAADLAALDTPLARDPDDEHDLVEWLARDVEDEAPWVFPGMLRRRDRVIIVAEEGVGKAVVCRTLAMCAAFGVRPFYGTAGHRPVSALLCDFENPTEAIQETGRRIAAKCADVTGAPRPSAQLRLWHREQGIDLRSRRDRAEFEAILRRHRPELVVIGPLYKTFRRQGREDFDQVAEDVTSIIDKLRVRYDFALVLEHHAPKGSSGLRDLIPFGSSVWQRWPEMGITLRKGDLRGLDLGRFRGDRMRREWPESLRRGESNEWPWVGRWETDQRRFAA